MAALFALGVMNLTWMAVIAALIAFEKLTRLRRTATVLPVTVLTAIAVSIVAAPRHVPGLVLPAKHGTTVMISRR